MEEERLVGIAKDRQKMEEKIEEEKKLKDQLKEQMLELRARDQEVSFYHQRNTDIWVLFY